LELPGEQMLGEAFKAVTVGIEDTVIVLDPVMV
jgi:hypothetical protein